MEEDAEKEDAENKPSRSISKDYWAEFDKDAERMNMNRSQFDDFLYRHWKKKNRFNIRDIVMLLCLALLFVILIVVR